MSIVNQARHFVESLLRLALMTPAAWRICPHCGSQDTVRHGTYTRRPYTLQGRLWIPIQRHRCRGCGRTYGETSPYLVARSWYSREVHRKGVDLWLHGRTSLRRAVEWLRSEIGHQERFGWWQRGQVQQEASREPCYLAASTLCRWLDRAGVVAQQSIRGQLQGVHCSGQMGADGLWARLRGGLKRVMLMLTDSVSGLVYPIVVGESEAQADWESLFWRARQAGLEGLCLDGLTSDGSPGLYSSLRTQAPGVHLQRCVWHLWRNLRSSWGKLGDKAQEQLQQLVHQVLDAGSFAAAEVALAQLGAHRQGSGLARRLRESLGEALVHLEPGHQGLIRVGPEWLWRDFRLRLSRGRNHCSPLRLQRAGLVWGIYHNFTPAQERSEHHRHYKHPGLSPLEVAGSAPGELSYLDALQV